MKEVMKQYFMAIHIKSYRVYNKRTMYVEEPVHIIFDETNFMTSEQDSNNFKIGLANLEDLEDVTKEKDQRAIGEQLIQEQTEVPDQAEQLVNKDQQGVPNPAVPRNEQNDLVEDELNSNQVSDPVPTIFPTKEFVAKPLKYQKCHPLNLIISDLNKGTQTRSQMRNFYAHFAFLSDIGTQKSRRSLERF